MTVRDCYEACLIELNKVLAPSLLINDFVYLLNKNIQEYFNKKYNSFEKIQQNTDDLRHLINQLDISGTDLELKGSGWECKLPSDYVHILGCRATFKISQGNKHKCDKNEVKYKTVGVNKLDTNLYPQVWSNWYMLPSSNRPYYLIININLGDGPISKSYPGASPTPTKTSGNRYGNSTQPVMLILCGTKDELISVEIQYLLTPRYVSLSLNDLDTIADTTEPLEFSDYVCNEIVKQLVTSILENQKDQRLQTYIPVNQSIPQN